MLRHNKLLLSVYDFFIHSGKVDFITRFALCNKKLYKYASNSGKLLHLCNLNKIKRVKSLSDFLEQYDCRELSYRSPCYRPTKYCICSAAKIGDDLLVNSFLHRLIRNSNMNSIYFDLIDLDITPQYKSLISKLRTLATTMKKYTENDRITSVPQYSYLEVAIAQKNITYFSDILVIMLCESRLRILKLIDNDIYLQLLSNIILDVEHFPIDSSTISKLTLDDYLRLIQVMEKWNIELPRLNKYILTLDNICYYSLLADALKFDVSNNLAEYLLSVRPTIQDGSDLIDVCINYNNPDMVKTLWSLGYRLPSPEFMMKCMSSNCHNIIESCLSNEYYLTIEELMLTEDNNLFYEILRLPNIDHKELLYIAVLHELQEYVVLILFLSNNKNILGTLINARNNKMYMFFAKCLLTLDRTIVQYLLSQYQREYPAHFVEYIQTWLGNTTRITS